MVSIIAYICNHQLRPSRKLMFCCAVAVLISR
jgi:hypothetical protein